MINRRQFLWNSLCATFTFASAATYSYEVEPHLLMTKSYNIVTPKWPADRPPLHLAMAGDFHVGCPSVDQQRLRKIVDDINAMNADAIMLVGDYITSLSGPDRVVGGSYV